VLAEDVVTIEAPVTVSGRLAKVLSQASAAYDVVVHDETHTAQHAAAAAHVAGRYLA
jgi:hypothetical protein